MQNLSLDHLQQINFYFNYQRELMKLLVRRPFGQWLNISGQVHTHIFPFTLPHSNGLHDHSSCFGAVIWTWIEGVKKSAEKLEWMVSTGAAVDYLSLRIP